MENASKALIIAGAILLAIVIISLGLVVVNNSRSSIDNASTNSQEIETFNNKFTAFEGTTVSGTKVKTLIQTVIAENQANIDNDSRPQIKINGKDPKNTSDVDTSSYKANKNYKVIISNYEKGFVQNINITE